MIYFFFFPAFLAAFFFVAFFFAGITNHLLEGMELSVDGIAVPINTSTWPP